MIARALKLLVSLSVASGVLLLGAAAGGAFAPARAAPGQPARTTGAVASGAEIPVGDALRVNGQPMQLSILFTSDAPEQVVLFHAQAFRARGLVPVIGPGHVSAFDPGDGRQRFVTAVSRPDGETLVMAGAADLRHPPRLLHAAQHAGFPVPPGSRGFLGYASEDAGTRVEAGQFVSPLTPREVEAFYRGALAGGGWSERKEDSRAGLTAFVRGGEVLSVAIQALDETKGAAVFVTRSSGALQ